MENTNPVLVSIRCLVFNHEPYLRQCLDGFVMQKTAFRFEAIIHDDASTDNSASIIREYAERYPEIIKPIFETENQYSKNDGSLRRIMAKACIGKYQAGCDGDDYWTDPLKLQKQVDYMESHPECSMCFGNAIEHWEDDSYPDQAYSSFETRDYKANELLRNWKVPTASFLYRSEILKTDLYDKVQSDKKMIVGDLPLLLTCAHFGSLHAFSDFFSVYRRHRTGFTRSINSSRRLGLGELWEEIPHLFGREFMDDSFFYAVYNFRCGLKDALKEGNVQRSKELRRKIATLYFQHPVSGLKRLIRVIKEHYQ